MKLNRNKLVELSTEEFVEKLKKENNESSVGEMESWCSTKELITKLVKSQDCIISFEHKLPYSLERIDCCIQKGNKLLVIEIKQWSNDNNIEQINGNHDYILFEGKERRNPYSQVCQYCSSFFYNYKEFSTNILQLIPIVIMPNYILKNSILEASTSDIMLKKVLTFDSTNLFDITDFIDNIDGNTIDLIDKLEFNNFQNIVQILNSGNTINLINDEIPVYNDIKRSIISKNDIVITGDAGSGKTVLALKILKLLIENGYKNSIIYAGSNELVSYFEKNINENYIQKTIFKKYFQAINNVQNNSIIVFDESQRMRKQQVDQIFDIKKSKNIRIIWFIDDSQSIEVEEDNKLQYIIGKYEDIIENVSIKKLHNQFRCNGDIKYIESIKALLHNKLNDKIKKNISVHNNIHTALEEYNSSIYETKGIIASDSWKAGNIHIDDISFNTIKDFGVWQNKEEEKVASVYKAMGGEKNLILFLWGKDFIYRNGKWVIQKEFITNRRWKTYLNDTSDEKQQYLLDKIKAIYYVLLTRFKDKMIIYIEDDTTYEFIKDVFEEEE